MSTPNVKDKRSTTSKIPKVSNLSYVLEARNFGDAVLFVLVKCSHSVS